jgi:hypothetical protein
MRTTESHAFIAFLSLAIYTNVVCGDANFTALCEEVRQEYLDQGIYNNTKDLAQLQCGACFNAMIPPALRITANLTFCMAQNSGYQRSHALSH